MPDEQTHLERRPSPSEMDTSHYSQDLYTKVWEVWGDKTDAEIAAELGCAVPAISSYRQNGTHWSIDSHIGMLLYQGRTVDIVVADPPEADKA